MARKKNQNRKRDRGRKLKSAQRKNLYLYLEIYNEGVRVSLIFEGDKSVAKVKITIEKFVLINKKCSPRSSKLFILKVCLIFKKY